MQRKKRFWLVIPSTLLLAMLCCDRQVHAQPPAAHTKAATAAPAAATSNDMDPDATQQQLLKLLRLSPTLTMVVARDPSLLADQDYVNRSNPELAQFLQAHPEVVRNPGFYLFSHLNKGHGRAEEALERAIWPDLTPAPPPNREMNNFVNNSLIPALGGLCTLISFLWLIRMLLENRRWSRIFRMQTEVHARLIERFSNNQELLTYMDTEAGKRFLEAAPIPVEFNRDAQRVPGAVARVLMPLQIGVVLTLLGIGLLLVRSSEADLAVPLLVFGIVVLMPGLGFIISAGITWFLAGRLGLLPESAAASSAAASERQ